MTDVNWGKYKTDKEQTGEWSKMELQFKDTGTLEKFQDADRDHTFDALYDAIAARQTADGKLIFDGYSIDIKSFLGEMTDADGRFDRDIFQITGIEQVAFLHFTRNLLNKNATINYNYIISDGYENYKWLDKSLNAFHHYNYDGHENNENTFKVVSKVGGEEYIFRYINNGFELVVDPRNAGSYNFSAPGPSKIDNDSIKHFNIDMVPWAIFGNAVNDPSNFNDRPQSYLEWLSMGVLAEQALEPHVGGDNPAQISGTSGDDRHEIPNDKRENYTALDGNDIIISGPQEDVIDGGAGSDTVSYINSPSGVAINLELGFGHNGNASWDNNHEILISIENVIGSNHGDILIGSSNDNKMIGGAGADYLDGGVGEDAASYETAAAGVIASLGAGSGSAGDAEGDTLINIENLTGSAFDDQLTGDADNNKLIGGGGADQLDGGAGDDTASYETATVGVIASLKAGAISAGDAEGDIFISIENLTGSAFDDQLTGDEGNNKLIGGGGADLLDGGAGDDTASYETATVGVIASLKAGASSTGEAAGDSFISIENLTGSAYADRLTGDDKDNTIFGNGGDDVFIGGRGNDWLSGGINNDTYNWSFGDGTDRITDFGGDTDILNLDFSGSGVRKSDVTVAADGSVTYQFQGRTFTAVTVEAGGIEHVNPTGLLPDVRPDPTGAWPTAGNDVLLVDGYDPQAAGTWRDADVWVFSGSSRGYQLSDITTDTDGYTAFVFVDPAGENVDKVGVLDRYGQPTWTSRGFFSYNTFDVGAGPGDDIITVTAGRNKVAGGTGVDNILFGTEGGAASGGEGNDYIKGNGFLFGGAGNNTLVGQGNAVLVSQSSDVLVGNGYETGTVSSDFAAFNGGVSTSFGVGVTFTGIPVNVDLAAQTAERTYSNWLHGSPITVTATLLGINNVVADSGADTLLGSSQNDILIGLQGDDELVGREGDDTLIGGRPLDDAGLEAWFSDPDGLREALPDSVGWARNGTWQTVLVPQVDAGIYTSAEIASATKSYGLDFRLLSGFTAFQDTLDGGAGNDTLIGNGQLSGGADDDVLAGNGTLGGGSGNDTLFGIGTLSGEDGNDSLYGVGILSGGAGNDRIVSGVVPFDPANPGTPAGAADSRYLAWGGSNGSIIDAGAGNDEIWATSVDLDHIDGGTGDDTLYYDRVHNQISANFTFYQADDGTRLIYDDSGAYGADFVKNTEWIVIDGVKKSTDEWFTDVQASVTVSSGEVINLAGSDLPQTIITVTPAIDAHVSGGERNDRYFGNTGRDTFNGNDGDDVIYGGDGDDTLSGGKGNDTIHGGNGADSISGDGGSDVVNGGAGDDRIIVAYLDGVDAVDGGEGSDYLFLSRYDVTTSITFSIADPSVKQTLSDGTTIVGIEQLEYYGSNTAADTVAGGALDDIIYGNGGGDRLAGGGGNDQLLGGASNDIVDGGSGNDRIWVYYQDGVDAIDGGDGTDYLFLSRYNATTNIVFSIADPSVKQTLSDGTTIVGIEQLEYYGSNTAADDIMGGALDDAIYGNGGNDRLIGQGGNDRLEGGLGNDTIEAGAGNDRIWVYAQDGVDAVDGGEGADYLFLSRYNVETGITFSIADPSVKQTLSDGTTLVGIEQLEYYGGNTAADDITGGELDDIIYGNGGDDTLSGRGGNDKLYGGAGTDTLVYGGNFAAYTIDLAKRTISSTAEGTDTFADVEFALFADGRYDFATRAFTPTVAPNTAPQWAGTGETITRVSTSADGEQANDSSILAGALVGGPVFSPDGTKILFYSDASNLVPGDTNARPDIFVKNLATGEIERVSTSAAGEQANSYSYAPVFSRDGTKVLFYSDASNLVAQDTNKATDIFVKDLTTGVVTLVSTTAAGAQGSDGSFSPVFSPDGSKVLFYSDASNLVPGDTNARFDIFVKDLITGQVTLLSSNDEGVQGDGNTYSPVFSPDGTKVVFESYSSNLVPDDTNDTWDIFIKDLTTGSVTRISTGASGTEGNGYSNSASFSADGTKVVFYSDASNLVEDDTNAVPDVFVKDLTTGSVTRISTDAAGAQGNDQSTSPAFSPDGTKIVFSSGASNLVAGDTNGAWDIFVKDLATGAVTLVSATASGAQGSADSLSPIFSPDGSKVLFSSNAPDLVPGDANGTSDYFVKDLVTSEITRVAASATGQQGNGDSFAPAFSPDGTKLAFYSSASNLTPNDTNQASDIFVRDLAPVASSVTATLTDDASKTALSATGALYFTDADVSDTHSVSVKAQAGVLGTLIASVVADGAGAGHVAWSYSVDETLVKPLGAGETAKEIFTLTLDDGHGGTITQDVTVTVNGIDHAPLVSAPATAGYYENGTDPVLAASATDPDGDALTWSLSGSDADLFAISADGTLSFKSVPDFEAPADADEDNVYEVVIWASDGDLATAQAVAITVTNVNEAPWPSIYAPEPGATATASVDENGLPVVLALSGADPEDDALTFSLSGADAASFELVDGITLAFKAVPDFEAPADGDGDGIYHLIITASDGRLSGSRALDIVVANVDEAPVITAPSPVTVPENTASVVASVQAADPEGRAITWSLSGADGALFDISPEGIVTFKAAPDFETPQDLNGDNVYDVWVMAGDGTLSSLETLAVTVADVNEAPVLTVPAAASFAENGTGPVATIGASDPDGDALTFALSGADAALFALADDGTLRFKAAPDYEASADAGGDNIYDVTITVSDGALSVAKALAVTVTDVSESTGPVPITGDGGANSLTGTSGADLILAGAGNDIVRAGDGDDTVSGDEGSDQLFGGAGNDQLSGGAGLDMLWGEAGDDTLSGGSGLDQLFGGTGNDKLAGGDGNDMLWGDAGDDTLAGDAGLDQLFGGTGNDRLTGGAGNDMLWGDAGDDTLAGNAGNDLLFGGAGRDTFVFKPGDGHDLVADFSTGAGSSDRIALDAAAFADYQALVQSGALSDSLLGAQITYDDGSQITLLGVRAAAVSADSFFFV